MPGGKPGLGQELFPAKLWHRGRDPAPGSKMIGRDKLSTKMFYVYILENEKGKHYIGSCEDLESRLKRHNRNSVRSTKNKGPFKLIYKEEFVIRTEARKRENQLKSYKRSDRLKSVTEVSTLSSSLV